MSLGNYKLRQRYFSSSLIIQETAIEFALPTLIIRHKIIQMFTITYELIATHFDLEYSFTCVHLN